jgi:hypothetical protein
MIRRASLVFACTLALVAVPVTAEAHEDSKSDGNDTPGLLDLSSASVGDKHGLVHTVKTFSAWSAHDSAANRSS